MKTGIPGKDVKVSALGLGGFDMNNRAVDLELNAADLSEIETGASRTTIQGERLSDEQHLGPDVAAA